jgi:cardiolipin synthase (CMP-forming)
VPPEEPDRLATIPNLLTLVRLLCLPLFLWLLFGHGDRAWAAILLAALGATDWCDGFIARRFGQESSFGRIFDPTVDRLLFLVAVGAIAIDGSAPVLLCAAVLLRELAVTTTTLTITALGAQPVRVTWFGKAATFLLMFSFPLFLAGASTMAIAPAATSAAWITGIPGIVLSYYAAARYVPQWRDNLREARSPSVSADHLAER